MSLPPLVSTGPPASLGNPALGGFTIFGGDGSDPEPQSGARFTAGYWLDPCHLLGVEGSAFFLAQHTGHFVANSAALGGVLARPFIDVSNNNQISTELTALPGLASGSVRVDLPSQLWGAEANLRHNLLCGCNYRVDALAGFRYLDLQEGLRITEQLVSQATFPAAGPIVFAGDHITVNDRFDTRNQFYGGQVGIDAELHRGPWFVDVRGKLALGATHQAIDIAGNQIITGASAPPRIAAGGLLAEPGANIGHFTRNRFSVVPELGVNVGYEFGCHLRAFVGYNFLYWTEVVRPGDQVDLRLNPNLNPIFSRLTNLNPSTIVRPIVPFKSTDYWVQGINAGVEFRY
jgi:hypothetical protein